ncbi:importin subunit beta-1-like [Hydractinia symbiolongicarpus]|uniref:importin subunit beta-1-like n=1 Tax=Hydractinia symbiolongicarpus TaxID=13093 RepID=UPI0025502EE6|nr:importin subunit beta-1-like [Hydractinia symbiolongicarpus]
MDLKKVLEATVSPDQNELQAALKFLEEAAAQNFPQFLSALSSLLANTSESPVVRQAAGIQLKNCLVAKDHNVKQVYHQRWYALDENVRNAVKTQVFQALGTETAKPSSAASCISGIASAELPHNLWPDLMNSLCNNAASESSSEQVKEATLEAIGYICQDIDAQFLTNYAANILRVIVNRMGNEETNNNIRFAATTAFLNSLEFIRGNFEKQDDRNYIMTVLCQATQCPEKRVKVSALQCLVKIITLYYEYMEAYMGPALFAITVDAMKCDEDDVVLQGVEFWSSVCDEELDLAIEAQEAEESGTEPQSFSRFYAKGALQYLTPILLHILTKQEEYDDEEDWTPHKAAGVCLMLLASCCDNEIVQHVLPFIQSNLQSTEWKLRDAAVMAFGSIMEGPNSETLSPIVKQGMPFLLQLMKDKNMIVRDSVAWALSRICDQVPEVALSKEYIDNLLDVLIENLESEPRVATNVCWAFSSLADASYENAQQGTADDDDEPATTVLSKKFEAIVNKIIITGDRSDAHLNNLRSSAYEAVMELVKNSPKDVYPVIGMLIMSILAKMDAITKMEKSGGQVGDHSQHNDFKSLLCAALQATLRKLKKEDTLKIADNCMSALLEMLNMSKVGGVQEDAFMAVGTLVECIGENFNKYFKVFKPFLIQGLQNRAEYQVCISAIGVVGDLCRGIGGEIAPFCDEIMQSCIENLADNTVHRSVKPYVLSLFGDIALAVGANFKKYAEVVLATLCQAAAVEVDKNDYDMVDYLNELRDACLEAFTGIIQGLKGEDENNVSPDVEVVKASISNILKFIDTIGKDPDRTDSLVGACCGLLGDICTAFGAEVVPLIDVQNFQELLQEGRRSKTAKTKTLAVWASKAIRTRRK